MPAVSNVSVKSGDVVVLVGTMKGLFVFRAGRERDRWEMGGPYFPGLTIYSAFYDDRQGRHRIWAGVNSFHWGAVLCYSDDFGASWSDPEKKLIRFPEDTEASLNNIWQITIGCDDEPDTLYAGVEPAALFFSGDAGASWSLVRGLWDHPHRPQWMAGFGGLCLHTVLPDPKNSQRVVVAISSGGAYRTDDGGETWRTAHKGVRAEFMPDKYPEFGQCVHKIVRHPSNPDRLFLQNHWGLYRSEDAGDSWTDIANGVPSDFGFAMEIDPNDANTVYIIPIEADVFRCTPEGKLRVYRTRNGGESWEPLSDGLPQENAYETILRDGMSSDGLNPTGLYFGTRSGKLFGTSDGGDSWQMMIDGLPPVACVKTAVVG